MMKNWCCLQPLCWCSFVTLATEKGFTWFKLKAKRRKSFRKEGSRWSQAASEREAGVGPGPSGWSLEVDLDQQLQLRGEVRNQTRPRGGAEGEVQKGKQHRQDCCKSGCQEKGGNRTVSGGGCTFIQEFCPLGFSRSQNAGLVSRWAQPRTEQEVGLRGWVKGIGAKLLSTSEGVGGVARRKELEGRLGR